MAHNEVITVTREKPTLMQRLLRAITLGPYNPKDKTIAKYFSDGGKVYAGVSVNHDNALEYSPVWAALNLVAGDLAGVPLILYRRTAKGKERYPEHPLYELIHDRPNPEMGSELFRETLQWHAMLYGNGYAEIVRGGPTGTMPLELWPLMPWQVEPVKEGVQPLYYKVWNPVTNDYIRIEARNMLHIRGLGSGVCGIDFVRLARQSLGLGIATERFASTFFGNGTQIGGILMAEGNLSERAFESLSKILKAKHTGVDNAHRLLALPGIRDFKPFNVTANEAQFLESRQFQVEEVARWFGIPPYLLRRTEGTASYASTEQQRRDYYTVLYRWAKKWESELQMKLIFPAERKIQFFEHVWESFLAADTQARASFYSALFQMAAMTPNEIRERENLNPIEGGDTAFVQLNLVPIDKAREAAEAIIAKKEQPTSPQPPREDETEGERQWREKCEELRGQFDALRIAAATLEADLAHTKAQRDKVEADHVEVRGKNAELEVKLASQIDQAAEWQRIAQSEENAHRATRETLEAERAAHEATKQIVRDREGTIQTLAVELDAARETIERRDARIETLEAELKIAAEHILRHESDLSARSAEIQALTADLETERAARARTQDERDRLLSELEGAKSALVERESELQAARESGQQLQEQLDGEIDRGKDAINARDLAERERDEARNEAEAAKRDAEDARARAVAAESAKQLSDKALADLRASVADKLTALVTANRALLVDAIARMIAVESDRARLASATPAKLQNMTRRFYAQHESQCADRLVPIVSAHLALIGSQDDPVRVARDVAHEHVQASLEDLRVAIECDPPEEMPATLEHILARWEKHRPNALADKFVRDAMTAVRNL